MDIDKIKKDVIYSNSQSQLFEITVELTEEISKFHIELVETNNNKTKAELKGKISLLSMLQNIIDKRIEDVRGVEKGNERKELLTNRQFKIASEMILKKETYNRIVELSLINYRKLKDQKVELNANKLE
jgi:hypothetical protein